VVQMYYFITEKKSMRFDSVDLRGRSKHEVSIQVWDVRVRVHQGHLHSVVISASSVRVESNGISITHPP